MPPLGIRSFAVAFVISDVAEVETDGKRLKSIEKFPRACQRRNAMELGNSYTLRNAF